jgi:diguanylate cyclase (GGDEF)-like protein/PAS domain S-box-containing protein
MILLGALMPWASNIIDLTNLSAFPNLDLTPLAFTLTGMSFAYGILRYRFLDIVPVAHDALVEVMNDGVLVLDGRERIVYINSAAQRLLGNGGTAAIGRYAEEVLASWPGLAAFSRNVTEGQAETVLVGQTGRHLEARIATLQAQGGHVGGRSLLLRDITDRKVAEDELQQAHKRLQLQLAEIEALHTRLKEEAIRDYLTGLFNRRYLEETLEREIARCEREREPLSVAVLDADLFKEINDGYGHKAGDIMLQATARLLMANIRRGDAACRYGGDEFVVILPGASLGNALQRLERLRSLIAALRVPYESSELHATVSIGLAAYPDHGKTGDALLRAADDALYAAKNAGGNCVMTARRRKGPPPNDECSCSTPI